MNKIITVIVKIAGLVITAPVIWGVAGRVFADVEPESLRLLVQVSALSVVGGVFLASWLALDGERNAPDAVKCAMESQQWQCTLAYGYWQSSTARDLPESCFVSRWVWHWLALSTTQALCLV